MHTFSPRISFPEESKPEQAAAQEQTVKAEPIKVIIKLASAVAPLPPLSTNNNNRKESASDEKENGCSCEKIDSCPIEMMDFSFAVSCSYGTVRCCRPVKSTPAPLVKRPITKKPAMCKCKSRKECDLFFHVEESEQIDRKDECPAGSVRCCENGNMGNPKDQKDAHQILGNSDFRPVQLPYLKMPNTEVQKKHFFKNSEIKNTLYLFFCYNRGFLKPTPLCLQLRKFSRPRSVLKTPSPHIEFPK